jgi:hypothetical protein
VAYKVLVGMDYPPDRRAEIGDVVDDLPATSAKWLLAQGMIEEIDGKPAKTKPAAERAGGDS